MNENLDQWPHINELVQCYRADWVKDEAKYGHFENVASTSFQNQIFEGPDTDIETGDGRIVSYWMHYVPTLTLMINI